ncbi:MAG: type II toxin-antitoxin system HicB family antitoxin [Spirochaetales bacterium]|nr:type II toxin-antitoxin system HicB family antitoxin [Spirochaetales bacterium]
MKFKVIVHIAEEGGFWAEVPSIPGCVSQAESLDELKTNIQDAIEGCLSVDMETIEISPSDQVLEVAI